MSDFHLQDRVVLRHHSREVTGWVRGKLYTVPMLYDVQTDKELVKGLMVDGLKPVGEPVHPGYVPPKHFNEGV